MLGGWGWGWCPICKGPYLHIPMYLAAIKIWARAISPKSSKLNVYLLNHSLPFYSGHSGQALFLLFVSLLLRYLLKENGAIYIVGYYHSL